MQQARGERVFLAHGDRDHFDVGMAAQQFAGGLQAADARHFHIHQDDVGFKFPGQLERRLPRIPLTHHLQAVDVGQHACNTGSYQIVIIDH
ncbi:hypothetical protein D3C81_1963900 [compost metagenome]